MNSFRRVNENLCRHATLSISVMFFIIGITLWLPISSYWPLATKYEFAPYYPVRTVNLPKCLVPLISYLPYYTHTQFKNYSVNISREKSGFKELIFISLISTIWMCVKKGHI